jgi:hypothetical protein
METETLTFEVGKATCARAPGKFCPFFRTKSFGTEFVCAMFDSLLFEKDGWTQRAKECLDGGLKNRLNQK